jgi:apolipoprotein D and lipocalin family protein
MIIDYPISIWIHEVNMVKMKIMACIVIILSFHQISLGDSNDKRIQHLKTVEHVNLEKYIGLWYEIAKIPNRFQKMCIGNTTAQYALREDGRIDVLNRCMKNDGSYTQAKGIAKIADINTNAKLKVSFVRILGISLFWGDYWIIGLNENYQYAVVGEPSRKYGWILSRKPELLTEQWNAVNQILTNQGYDPETFVKTVQNSLNFP